ncbi:bifunctional phosphoribosyl-AMP cyclohydrolase/phosphoribosyl-ATP diphosphatase HisIE [Runella sp. CRIBMP]|uniref:bifunctional phosphoribosyl-AMP cyclohydrolase/phosphoribosyl-ATP diphosphatase HisIE n=1 Tax=Runella sp. CRIBMP TaxID=2683261 RepID=UPI00141240DC|nr:bifunctional phosphoribosyl-AMP cyclohydrolase/phosphoribosyl-ATP diphosphatase HisIE [Runella sp. CRIBMP]NBB21505.1 bifunctional phosphoribosyl-AMP cyclohydrolase/phosphoribosyl-ATP diphosphatase HisIE [Runella sp. CRIBMP]
MKINFEKSPDGLVPAVVQDHETGKVLMLGYMNEEALAKTEAEKVVTFFSRSKQRLWTKGETSGNFLEVKAILVDCDQDTILIKAHPIGPTCHTGADTCFFEKNEGKASFLNYLQKQIIRDRKNNPSDASYTSKLFQRGVNKIAQKVGEEAVELVIEAKDTNDHLFKNEAADLLFHYLILLEQRGMDLDDIVDVLKERHK